MEKSELDSFSFSVGDKVKVMIVFKVNQAILLLRLQRYTVYMPFIQSHAHNKCIV